MPDRRLYVLGLSKDAQTRTRSKVNQNLSRQSAVGGGGSTVEEVSLEPGQQLLTGEFRGEYAPAMGEEVERLFRAPDIGAIPYYGDGVQTSADGYFALSDVSVEPPDPRSDISARFDGSMERKGTPETHWRAIETNPTTVDNDFVNTTTGEVAIPASASKVQWWDGVTSTESATVQATRTGWQSSIASTPDADVYDTEQSSFSAPTLLYEVDYSDEAVCPTHVYDTRGNADPFDADGVPQWDHVFVRDWPARGRIVLDNRFLRLYFDEPANSLNAEEYSSGSWSSVGLGASDWQLWDLDLRRVGLARIDARVTFENTTDGSLYTLAMTLHRGQRVAQFYRTPNASSATPSGLQTKLDPIASTSAIDPQAVKTLVARSEVQA
jgi:hypothetical protein